MSAQKAQKEIIKIKSRYNDVCRSCRENIKKGDFAFWTPETKEIVCNSCYSQGGKKPKTANPKPHYSQKQPTQNKKTAQQQSQSNKLAKETSQKNQPEKSQKQQSKKDPRLKSVDEILMKDKEIKKLKNKLNEMKACISNEMAKGEILASENGLGTVSITIQKRKKIKNDIVKGMLKDGSMTLKDFRAIFEQELKLTELGEKLLVQKDKNILKCVGFTESVKFNVNHDTKKNEKENVVNFPETEPDFDEIPF